MLSCIGETKSGHVLSRTVIGSPSRCLMFSSNFMVSGLLNPVPMTNRQKTKPRGDRVVYTCRVDVESAKYVASC
ncbi:hypothetical protein HanIR_Chr09g0421941 [Helianthus annuus]|nr:hypothetical protein HanIR_Chr09g0421941 [Helianthus annuus]